MSGLAVPGADQGKRGGVIRYGSFGLLLARLPCNGLLPGLGGDEQERSVDQQRREAEAYCARHHLVLVRVFADEARPGGTVVGREAFEELIHYCRQMAPDVRRRSPEAPAGILLWDLKRFARNTLDNAFFKADLRRRGYELVFLSDNIPSGDIGHVYEAMLEWKAQQDLDDISKDVKRGLSDLVGTRGPDGQYLGLCPGRPPTGFRGEPTRWGRSGMGDCASSSGGCRTRRRGSWPAGRGRCAPAGASYTGSTR